MFLMFEYLLFMFLEKYVQCKEIISYFSLKWGCVCNKMGGGGLTFNEKFIKWGGGSSLLMEMGRKKSENQSLNPHPSLQFGT